MTAFSVAHATADDWGSIARQLAKDLAAGDVLMGTSGPDQLLGFLYVTDLLAGDMGSILTYLRQTTNIEHWTGTTGIGICATGIEYFDRPATVAMVGAFGDEQFHIFPALTVLGSALNAESRKWTDAVSAPFAVVHGDPNNADTSAIIEDLGLATSAFLVGGLSASRGAHPQVADAEIVDSDAPDSGLPGGLSGVFFAPTVEVATGLSQGCLPVGPSHVVSDCVDNVIIGLDGQEALSIFKDDVGELLSRDLSRAAGYIHAAFPIEGSDTGDYVVRNLIGIDAERGWLAVGEEINAGDRVMFVRRDPKSAEDDMLAMLKGLKKRLPGPPRGGLYFSCVARGPNMFGQENKEASLIRDVLGDFPLAGFFGNGEISNNRLYGYTGVLALFL